MADGIPAGGNTTDRALLRFLTDLPEPGVLVNPGKVIPFTSETKFMATDVTGDFNFTLIKGAPERIVACCTKYIAANGLEQPLLSHTAINRAISGMAGNVYLRITRN
jgi:magnesium-transporting ATPase (P-type)